MGTQSNKMEKQAENNVFERFLKFVNRYPDNHIGVLIENYEDLPDVGTRIQHRDGTIGVYVKDPFGYTVEYIWYSEKAKQILMEGGQ